MVSTATLKTRTREPGERVFVQMSRLATQGNAAGGAVVFTMEVPRECILRLDYLRVYNSGTNGITITVMDEDNSNIENWAVIGSAATTTCYLPALGGAATATANTVPTIDKLLYGGMILRVAQSGAGAQNDTMLLKMGFEHLATIVDIDPLISIATSTNAADVTLAGNTISVSNRFVRFQEDVL